MGRFLLVVLSLSVLAACNEDPIQPQHVDCNPFLLTYGEAGTDTVTVENDVRYIDVATGSGTVAAPGDVAQVNYSLYVDGGTLFESSCPTSYGVLTVVLGSTGTIPAFQTGIYGMREDGVRRVFIPADQAYDQGVLAGKALTFDIELVRLF